MGKEYGHCMIYSRHKCCVQHSFFKINAVIIYTLPSTMAQAKLSYKRSYVNHNILNVTGLEVLYMLRYH